MTQIQTSVSRYSNCDKQALAGLLARYGMVITQAHEGAEIAGSFWGDEEAGLLGNQLVLRSDTPLHSVLHETCHYICMDPRLREGLHTDAGGDYDEENAVCYLQILLADEIDGISRERMMNDMDAWGYTFRLGSARAWFEQDAEDAREWLERNHLISSTGQPTFQLRR